MGPIKAKWVTTKIKGKMSSRRSLESSGKVCCLAAWKVKEAVKEAVNYTNMHLILSVKENLL